MADPGTPIPIHTGEPFPFLASEQLHFTCASCCEGASIVLLFPFPAVIFYMCMKVTCRRAVAAQMPDCGEIRTAWQLERSRAAWPS